MTWEQYEEIKAWEEQAKKCGSCVELASFINNTSTSGHIYSSLEGINSNEKAKILWKKWYPNPHQALIDEWETSGKTKIVQYWHKLHQRWYDVEGLPIFSNDIEYRLKPEPEYIPFDFSDANKLIGKAVKAKDSSHLMLITIVDLIHVRISQAWIKYQELLDDYIFLNGTPCGKLKGK